MFERSSLSFFLAVPPGQGFYRIKQIAGGKREFQPEPSNRLESLNTEKRSATCNLRRSGCFPTLPYPPQVNFVFGFLWKTVKGFSANSSIRKNNSRHKRSHDKDLPWLWMVKKLFYVTG